MLRSATTCALVVVALVGAKPAQGQVNYPIDDFEVLPFHVRQIGAGWQTQTQAIPPAYVGGHIISSTRELLVSSSGDNFADAELEVTSNGDDELVLSVPLDSGSGVGEIWLTYALSPGGLDLTAGGSIDRIEADGRGTSGLGGTVYCRLTDTSNVQETAQTGISSLNYTTHTWWFSHYSQVDLTDVTEIQFRFDDVGSYYVREIRLRAEGSNDLSYVIHSENTFTPPIPSPPIAVTAFIPLVGVPLYRAEISITQAFAGFTPELQMAWSNVPSFDGSAGHLLMDWTDPAPFDALEFTLDLDFVPVVFAGQDLVPEIFPPDPVHGPEGVALRFPVQIRQGVGGPILWESEVWLNLMPGPDQAEGALEFAAASVTPHGADWTDGFSIGIALLPGAAGVETIWPILEASWWSDWRIYVDPTGVSDPRPGGITGPRLTAAPSVTRTGTTIRTSRPFPADARLIVHDLAGRRVVSLRPSAGSSAVSWDGRGGTGRELPSGVYFVRLEGAREDAVRVVKVR